MKFGSLLSGIGGMDLGLERAGMECIWQVEIDKKCRDILLRHWSNVRRYTDVKEVKNPRPVDLICGGWPCQDLSVAGKRAGLHGERSGLFFEALRIIQDLKPRWFILENVQSGTDNFPRLQCIVKITFIYNPAAGAVYDHDAIFHLLESVLIEQVGGIL